VLEHLTPELIVSSLRFLLESYKLGRERFKDKKAPEDIEKIVTRAERAEPKTLDAADLDRSITDALGPEDAAIVKGDLELLSLLILPAPKLDAFDYWGMLTRLIDGLHSYAIEKRLFELRGRNDRRFGQVLHLGNTGTKLLPDDEAKRLPIPFDREGLKRATGMAILKKDKTGFPIIVGVFAEFYQYSPVGGTPGVKPDMSFYEVGPGQQRHWLKFKAVNQYEAHFHSGLEYMLEASDLFQIVQALHEDIHGYATAVNADEQKIGPLTAAIDAFVAANTKSTS
jgi:hypothetical protein